MLNNLLSLHKNSNSINILRDVNKNISGRKFHESTYILYDLRSLLDNKEKTYLEIGSYIGSSASLIMQNKFKTNLICIDPCVLDKSHYKEELSQVQVLNNNLTRNNINNYNFCVYPKFSQDTELLQELKNKNTKVDILFIDGDHSYDAVIRDWNNYMDFVNYGGFICFDDYYDDIYSPEVRPAVDYIVKNLNKDIYEVIGSIENIHNINTNDVDYKHPNFINEFIIYKKNKIKLI